MRGWKGLLSGALALVLLQVLVSSRTASAGIGGVFGGAANLAEKLMDPKVPAVPARTTAPLSPVTATGYSHSPAGHVPFFNPFITPSSSGSATPSPTTPAPAVPTPSTQPLWS